MMDILGGSTSFGNYLSVHGGGIQNGNQSPYNTHGGAGGGGGVSSNEGKAGGSGLGYNSEDLDSTYGSYVDLTGGLGGRSICMVYQGAYCPMTDTVYGGGGGGASNGKGGTGGAGGEGGGGKGGDANTPDGEDGKLYGAGGGGARSSGNTPGNGHDGVCIIAY